MGREFELKFQANDRVLAALGAEFGPFSEIAMETVYFDTPDRDFHNLRWTLRRRMENGNPVCTVKTPASGGGRGEWETSCADIMDAIASLVAQGAPSEIRDLCRKGLVPVCGARFTRLAAVIARDVCTVELALDRGILLGGDRQLPFAEVEVELKQGSERDAVSFAQDIAGKYHLIPELKSKVQRAMELSIQE